MPPLQSGSPAPEIEGLDLSAPKVLFFYKVTCPVCQLAAPAAERINEAYPDRIVGVGQDDPAKLEAFAGAYGVTFSSRPDLPPYDTSSAYGVRVVPTLFLVEDGEVNDVVESWDRDGFNRVAARIAERTGAQPVAVSDPSDGLPPFRPG